jgi:hypothetical protein
MAAAGRPLESLPYLDFAARQPGAPWGAWRSFGAALYDASMMNRVSEGRVVPGARSSFERVALMRAALDVYAEAERLAESAGDRADVRMLRAQALKTWGLPWDTLHEYHEAGRLDPRWADYAPSYAEVMREPSSSIGIW